VTVVEFGRRQVVLRSRRATSVSMRFELRSMVVGGTLVLLIMAVGIVSLAFGQVGLTIGEVWGALAGGRTDVQHMVVVEWRLPRTLLAVLFGGALALSGALFQSLTRNPLGSPDIIGFSTGSYTGALLVIMVAGGGYYQVATGAVLGGIATAAVVYLLAYRRGVQGFRLIIVGIAVAAMLGSVNTWIIVRASLDDALRAAIWGAGSLNGLGFAQLWPALVVSAVLVPAAFFCAPALRQLELGDDAAAALGVRTNRVRLAVLVVGVALIAMVTAAAGPIAFVALVAPQIARRLTRTSGLGLIPAVLLGGLLLLVADYLAQRAFAPTQLPVGVVTVCLSGGYFVWLLVRETKEGTT
jgi:iron complex transport system permease protein